MTTATCQGAGIGLRPAHLQEVCDNVPESPWFEVHICNFLQGGLNRRLLSEVSGRHALSFHGVSLNLGGTDPLDREYLEKLRLAVNEYQPALISEHASFCAHENHAFHDLLPVPQTEEAVQHMAQRIREAQDQLGRRILLENVTRYYSYPESELSDAQFLTAVCTESDCGILLDLNNAWINECNLGIVAADFIDQLPLERVGEVHLAGHSKRGGTLIDSHSAPPSEAVWSLYEDFCELKPGVPCLIEWDSNLPPLAELLFLRARAQRIMGGGRMMETLECAV